MSRGVETKEGTEMTHTEALGVWAQVSDAVSALKRSEAQRNERSESERSEAQRNERREELVWCKNCGKPQRRRGDEMLWCFNCGKGMPQDWRGLAPAPDQVWCCSCGKGMRRGMSLAAWQRHWRETCEPDHGNATGASPTEQDLF